jgi:hypothetical protein
LAAGISNKYSQNESRLKIHSLRSVQGMLKGFFLSKYQDKISKTRMEREEMLRKQRQTEKKYCKRFHDDHISF